MVEEKLDEIIILLKALVKEDTISNEKLIMKDIENTINNFYDNFKNCNHPYTEKGKYLEIKNIPIYYAINLTFALKDKQCPMMLKFSQELIWDQALTLKYFIQILEDTFYDVKITDLIELEDY